MSFPEEAPFDIREELPLGVTVLAASAGTGKTYTIATLAARYVAAGLPLERLLLVSFTHAATGELRDRVRERLTDAHRALSDIAAGGPVPDDDELVQLLADASDTDFAAHRSRLARAVADFDAATITTTHGFCQEVLRSLGVAGDVDRHYHLLDDPAGLVDEVLADIYARDSLAAGPRVTLDEAREIVRLAIRNPTTPIAEPQVRHDAVAARVRLAQQAREEFDRRKCLGALLTFDDLLTRLRSALDGEGGPEIAQRLRRRYDVALIDEFQDTDPIQWAIVRRAFGGGDGKLVLIGDPKQAVYSFRGADVYEYLSAARAAAARRTLTANWRSGDGLVAAYDALFVNATLGHPEIVYRPVQAAANGRAARLAGLPSAVSLRIRVIRRDLESVALTGSKEYAESRCARANVIADLVAEIVAMLDAPAQIEHPPLDGGEVDRRSIEPHDLAVLVRTRWDADDVKAALNDAGVPAIVNATGSVFVSDAARQWLSLLEALERPADRRRAQLAALTPFVGWSPARVAGADAAAWEALHLRLRQWADVVGSGGVAALGEAALTGEGLLARLLGRVGGEREVTDLHHIAELLHAAAADGRQGITPLTSWLRRQVEAAEWAAGEPDAADRDGGEERQRRRLESDASAVRVLTIHSSKGLEFPVVFCPFLWTSRRHEENPALPVAFHGAPPDDRRMLDVSLFGGDYRRHRQRAWDEERGEELRLAYVALTRARCQAVVWWIGAWAESSSPLGRLVFARDKEDGTVPPAGRRTPTDKVALEEFGKIAGRAAGNVAVETTPPLREAHWEPPRGAAADLDVACLGRGLDDSWRRTSYSAIVAGQYEQRVASEGEEAVGADDALPGPAGGVAVADAGGTNLAIVPALLDQLPATARAGTLVHGVLEMTDFTAEDLEADLHRGIEERLARRSVEVGDPAALAAGLRAAIETSLGPLAGGLCLRDLGPADRLDELAFELPLVGGDEPSGEVTLDAVAAVIAAELPADDLLAAYPAELADPALRRVLRGYLTGSIDVVARIRQGDARPRFAVVDYKTNRLSRAEEPLTAWHHRPEALAAEMIRGHYVLQALFYSVALHRYLRWRLPDYDPERDVAGVLYLFLRGMTGPSTPRVDGVPCGVFGWRAPTTLVSRLSDLLEGGAPA
jgi:exodeoxyribonuclease V beta subunit